MESIDTARKEDNFSGYQWNLFSMQDGALRSGTQTFLASVNWPGLLEYAASKRNSDTRPPIAFYFGYWSRLQPYARIRMPCLGESTCDEATVKRQMSCEHRSSRWTVEASAVQSPKIGTIISINEDGTYEQGPIPGLGGQFDTATAFYTAWASSVEFRMSADKLRAASGPYAAEIIPGVVSFSAAVSKTASKLSVRDNGPFPLCHGDFGHNNIIVDDKYRIVGLLIDWEIALLDLGRCLETSL
ncbi:hypothetical protein EAF00_009669 [Botryotinia globosa]|nr:hypothetical protein EAF00_009669 [Botryotinia globosa]